MSDLISRQAAIDALNGEIEITGRTNAEAVKGYVRLVKDRLERLPSAQSEYTEQDARDSFNSGYACGMEAAQSEIIRCKDCAYWQREWSDERDYHYCTMEDDRTYREFYCANAERREG